MKKQTHNSSEARILTREEMTPFMRDVFDVVRKIPKGKVMTYAAVAESAGYPRAVRAVGTALSKNYDPAIPCHRVVGSNGKVGHYNRGGSEAKRALLTQEGAKM